MGRLTAAVVMVGMIWITGAWAGGTLVAQAPATGEKGRRRSDDARKGAVGAVQVRGTIAAIDKDQSAVTLKGPKGRMVTLDGPAPAR